MVLYARYSDNPKACHGNTLNLQLVTVLHYNFSKWYTSAIACHHDKLQFVTELSVVHYSLSQLQLVKWYATLVIVTTLKLKLVMAIH